jgi:signal transduction histidine kinase
VSRPASLRTKVARLLAITTFVSLVSFSAVVGLVVYLEDGLDLSFIPEADDEPAKFFLLVFAIAAPISLAITLTAARYLVRSAVRPIEAVIAEARTMTVDDLDRRIEVPPDRDELREMIETLNALFARLATGFRDLHAFAADVSHELRTPLAAVVVELEVALRRERSHAEWTAAAERALASLRRTVQLVEALLDLARGSIPGERERADVVAVVDEVAGTFTARADAAGITLAHVSDGEATATVDRVSLAVALGVLIDNAIRYTPHGGRVELAVVPYGDTLQIAVDDSGPGVDADEAERIFAPMVRGAAGHTHAGLGLGLAIARRVMEATGGRVDVEASDLGGARFTLAIPTS